MTHLLVGKHGTRQITYHLMHPDQNAPGIFRVEGHRLHLRIDLAPLLRPVSADFFRPTDETAFEGSGPSNVGRHGREGSINVSRIESRIHRA